MHKVHFAFIHIYTQSPLVACKEGGGGGGGKLLPPLSPLDETLPWFLHGSPLFPQVKIPLKL